jgi:hypothetical protein
LRAAAPPSSMCDRSNTCARRGRSECTAAIASAAAVRVERSCLRLRATKLPVTLTLTLTLTLTCLRLSPTKLSSAPCATHVPS